MKANAIRKTKSERRLLEEAKRRQRGGSCQSRFSDAALEQLLKHTAEVQRAARKAQQAEVPRATKKSMVLSRPSSSSIPGGHTL
jgi:hypothetical protein